MCILNLSSLQLAFLMAFVNESLSSSYFTAFKVS